MQCIPLCTCTIHVASGRIPTLEYHPILVRIESPSIQTLLLFLLSFINPIFHEKPRLAEVETRGAATNQTGVFLSISCLLLSKLRSSPFPCLSFPPPKKRRKKAVSCCHIPRAMSDEVSQFLEQVERLRGQQIEEDEVRARELEEYLAAKRERQARREGESNFCNSCEALREALSLH